MCPGGTNLRPPSTPWSWGSTLWPRLAGSSTHLPRCGACSWLGARPAAEDRGKGHPWHAQHSHPIRDRRMWHRGCDSSRCHLSPQPLSFPRGVTSPEPRLAHFERKVFVPATSQELLGFTHFYLVFFFWVLSLPPLFFFFCTGLEPFQPLGSF